LTDNSHRFLAELVGGAVHASKLWRAEQISRLKTFIIGILEKKLLNITEDTYPLWMNCLRNAVKDMDPMRLQWLFDWLLSKCEAIDPEEFSLPKIFLFALTSTLIYNMSYQCHQLRLKVFNIALRLQSSRFTVYRCGCAIIMNSCLAFDIIQPWSRPGGEYMTWGAFFHRQITVLKPITEAEFVVNIDTDKNPLLKQADTVCRLIKWCWEMSYSYMFSTFPEIYAILPTLVVLEGLQKDEKCVKKAVSAIQVCALLQLKPSCFPALSSTLDQMSSAPAWRCRRLCLVFIQQLSLNNLFMLHFDTNLKQHISTTVMNLLKDGQVEVRDLAASTLCGLLHCGIVEVNSDLLKKFIRLSNKKLAPKPPSSNENKPTNGAITTDARAASLQDIIVRHAGVLGVSACVRAFPYEVPDWMPAALMNLNDHLHDPSPIEATVRNTFLEFKRTHHDNWQEHKKRFSEDQLQTLSEILVAPSYYV
jgi:proteasome activator subunit 4